MHLVWKTEEGFNVLYLFICKGFSILLLNSRWDAILTVSKGTVIDTMPLLIVRIASHLELSKSMENPLHMNK